MSLRSLSVLGALTLALSVVGITGCSTESKGPDDVVGKEDAVQVDMSKMDDSIEPRICPGGGYYGYYNPCPYSAPYMRCNVYSQCWCSAY